MWPRFSCRIVDERSHLITVKEELWTTMDSIIKNVIGQIHRLHHPSNEGCSRFPWITYIGIECFAEICLFFKLISVRPQHLEWRPQSAIPIFCGVLLVRIDTKPHIFIGLKGVQSLLWILSLLQEWFFYKIKFWSASTFRYCEVLYYYIVCYWEFRLCL